MRTKNSIKNIYMGILTQIILTLLGFVSRKVFLDSLGTEYLGINGLLTNILSMLSLVEGGIGTSIVYNLYKPLAENNTKKITALVQLYKKLYSILAIIIFILSVGMYGILDKFIKGGTTVPYISIVYFIFTLKNLMSYLNAHKWSLINADQKGYILSKYNLIFSIVTTVSKILILKITNNYILFLLIEVIIFTIQNIYNGKIVNSMYPYIKTKQKYSLDKETKDNIVSNVKAIFFHNIGGYCVSGTDNLLISALVNIKTVGLYSNYTMIISQLSAIINPVLNGIGASVGNLIATEGKDKSYKIFNIIYLINFWIYSVATIFLYNFLEPFIIWWIGDKFLLDNLTFMIILFNFYISGLRNSINTFKAKAGIFKNDKYVPLLESVLNLVGSIILAKYIGLAGIFLATTISTILLPLWIQSKLVYNNVFNKSVIEYFKKYIFYIVITLSTGYITSIICNSLGTKISFILLVIRGIMCVTIPNLIYIKIFYKTDEFKYLLSVIKPTIEKLKVSIN